jgi:hypothetical protein
MRVPTIGLALSLLAACSTGEPPAFTSFELPGEYRAVAACLRSQFLATERNMVYVEDPGRPRVLLWEDREGNGGVGGRRFDLAIAQAAPGQVRVDLLRAGQTRFEEDRFAARLEHALGGCKT